MRAVLPVLVLFAGFSIAPAAAFELGFPADCALGETCFLQQGPDLDPSTNAADSWCGGATYDGHDGTDIRVRSLMEMGTVNVVAAADGVVLGMRNAVSDRLIMTEADRAAVAGIECGNGVVLDHGEGWVTQYCHMQLGSIAVASGQTVKRGDVLGKIGASGFVDFPHVHLSVRKDGVTIDPFSGRALSEGCGAGTPLWDAAVVPALFGWEGGVLDMGFAGGALDHDALAVSGAPPPPSAASEAFVGWAWFYNLKQGDEVTIRLETADGTTIEEGTQPALDRNKAAYSAFVGKRGAPDPGTYRVKAVVIRDGVPAITAEEEIVID